MSVDEFLLDRSQLSEGGFQLAMWIGRFGGGGDKGQPFTLWRDVVSGRDRANVNILKVYLKNYNKNLTMSSADLFLWKNKLTRSGIGCAGDRMVQDADRPNKDTFFLDSWWFLYQKNALQKLTGRWNSLDHQWLVSLWQFRLLTSRKRPHPWLQPFPRACGACKFLRRWPKVERIPKIVKNNPFHMEDIYLRKLTKAIKRVQVWRLSISTQGRSIKLNSFDSITARLDEVVISSKQAHGMSDKVLKMRF